MANRRQVEDLTMSIYNVMLINKPVGKIEIIKNSVNKIQLSQWFNEVYSNPEEFIVSRINIIHRENIQNICKIF